MSKQYSYIERKIPATPRNKRVAGLVTNAVSATGGGYYPGQSTTIDTGDLDRMFQLDTEADEIVVLKTIRSIIVKELLVQDSFIAECNATFNQSVSIDDALSVANQFTLNNKSVTGISRGIDEPLDKPSPYKLATTDYVSAFTDERYLRKDIDDTAHGNITFEQSIHSKDYIDGFETGRGWKIEQSGNTDFNAVDVRTNLVIGNRSGSPTFISGFPNGIGWDLSPYQRINAADVAKTKWRLEIDDINVRGQMRVYEFVISQLRGENDNVIFAGMMRVLSADPENEIIYLDTEKGVLYNPFRAGDILMVQRFGGMPSAENNYNVIKQYELRVKEAYVGNLSDGEERVDWIEVEKFVGDWDDVAARDVLTRVDSMTDATRKGIVKVTTVDEIGAPYIDVVYGMKTNPDTATKVRMGNLSGVRTRNNQDLTGVWGLYAEGAVLENSTYYMQDGNTVEQNFTILNGKLESEISTVKNDMSVEAGNILKNSSFGSNMCYWESTDEVHFMLTADGYIYANSYFYVEKNQIADIVSDNGRYALRIRKTGVKQSNSLFNKDGISFEGTTETDSEGNEKTIYPQFSFAFFYRPLTDGTLKVGFEGKELYAEERLTASSSYAQFSKYAEWDGTGDFMISYTGEILIYGVSLFNDKLADAKIYLEGKITQTAEALTVDYKKLIKDGDDKLSQSMTSQFQQTAEQIALRVTKDTYDTDQNKLKESINSQFSVQAGNISAVSQKVDAINNTITNAGWITEATGNTLWASVELEDGDKIISYINQSATKTTISAERIDLIGKVTFSMLSSDAVSGVQPDLSGYAKTSDLPDLSPYLKSETIISGGYIKTGLIDTDSIFANLVQVGQFKIQSGGQLSWVGKDYFDKNEFQMKLGSSKLPTNLTIPTIIHTFSSSGSSHAGIAAVLQSSTNSVAIYGSTDGWGSNWPGEYTSYGPFAGYFSGKVKVTGLCQAGTLAANSFRYAYDQGTDGSYKYYEGINVDPATYDLDNIRFRIRGGIIVGVTDDSGKILQGV